VIVRDLHENKVPLNPADWDTINPQIPKHLLISPSPPFKEEKYLKNPILKGDLG